jgi:uncharacterized glyoxalase superfamily protein PhnB
MNEQDKVPQNPPVRGGVVPHIVVSDASAATDFYKRAFLAEEVARMPAEDGKRLMHCHLYINGGSLMLCDAFPEYGHPLQPPQSFTLHIHVADDVDGWWNRAVAAGAEVAMPLEKQFWGDRYGQLRDPFGVIWSVASSAG